MPYYIYQKLEKMGAWECIERHYDFQAASKSTESYKKLAPKPINRDMLIAMVQGDTEAIARTVLENRTDETN